MSTAWFVTGTDTGVGKTTVTQAIVAAASQRCLRTAGYKPIESGCLQPDGQYIAQDAAALNEVATHQSSVTYQFAQPVAPAVAAAHTQQAISIQAIMQQARAIASQVDLLCVEGAGGLLVPISAYETIGDIAAALQYPLLIVAADKLGVMNHTLLTLEVAQRRGLPVAAVILCGVEQTELLELENLSQIRQHTKVPVLSFPHCPEAGRIGQGKALLDQLLPDTES